MKATMFHDPRANELLSRVTEDVSLLRQDVGNLFTHTARHTLPASAYKLADQAKTSLAAGRAFTAEQLNSLKIKQPAAAWVGGAAALGLLAAGAYLLLHNNHCSANGQADGDLGIPGS